MKRFTQLFQDLDRTTKTSHKVAAIKAYFVDVDPADAAWAILFLSGQKAKQIIPTKFLRQWAAEEAGVDPWLFNDCYEMVGDLAETMALILPDTPRQSMYSGGAGDKSVSEEATKSEASLQVDSRIDRGNPTTATSLFDSLDERDVVEADSLAGWMDRLLPLRGASPYEQRRAMVRAWYQLDVAERYVLHKMITGSFRVGVSQGLLVRGLAQALNLDTDTLSHRLMGDWQPTAEAFRRLMRVDTKDAEVSRPYPFFLAHALEGAPEETLAEIDQWQIEWKWDGIRATVIQRENQVFIWSRGEELVTERFPEIAASAITLPRGTVLDGEILGWKHGHVLPFGDLQCRIGRKHLTKRILDDVPVVFMAFDCLEYGGEDLRSRPLDARRALLEQITQDVSPTLVESTKGSWLLISPVHIAESWESISRLRATSREHQAEGLMIKRRTSPYRVGRPRGDWWKWKIQPYTIDAVLLYAQRGHGRRASLFTDYTFAVWDQGQLVSFAKAYSGLSDEEILRVDAFVRRNTLEKFGPVCSVKPELVFELACEDIRLSTRHKSGIAVRFPRIVRWRTDKNVAEADSLASVKALVAGRLGS